MITGLWSQDEHAKFLVAIKLYPQGPWRKVAAYVGTRSIRQVQTHAQKYHEKVVRRMRGLYKGRRSSGRKEHRIDDEMLAACKVDEDLRGVLPNRIEEAWPSPQQHPAISGFRTTAFMVELLLDSTPGSMSPGGLDSTGIADTVQAAAVFNTLCQLPTIDESLDFLIECLS